jgi:hypothetical protein
MQRSTVRNASLAASASESDLEKIRANREKRMQSIASKISMLTGASSQKLLSSAKLQLNIDAANAVEADGPRTLGTMASALSSSTPQLERSLSGIEPSDEGVGSSVIRTVASFDSGLAGAEEETAVVLPTSRTGDDAISIKPSGTTED